MNDTNTPLSAPASAPQSAPFVNKRISPLRGCYFFTLIASLVGAASQMILLLSEYDAGIGMYKHDSLPATLFMIFSTLAVAVIILWPIAGGLRQRLVTAKAKAADTVPSVEDTEEAAVTDAPLASDDAVPSSKEPDDAKFTLPPSDMPVIFASTLSGFIMVAVLILQFFTGNGDDRLLQSQMTFSQWSWVAVLGLTVPTAIFFFLPALAGEKAEKPHRGLSFFPIFWCIAYLLHTYFNNFTAISSPVRVVTELAIVASMLYFCMETRVRIGAAKPILLLICLNLAIFFSSICAIPIISVAFIQQWPMNTVILYSAVQLCFLTYFISRANTFIREG